MPRVVHFDISADQPERALAFYREVFGWRIEKWKGPFDYWLVMTGDPKTPGIDGGLARRDSPATTITNFIEVPSIDEYLGRVSEHGGSVFQDKQAIPGVGDIAVCRDTEGNLIGLIQNDTSTR